MVNLTERRDGQMVRRFSAPRREDYDTEGEYLEELEYYDQEMALRELQNEERYYERKYSFA